MKLIRHILAGLSMGLAAVAVSAAAAPADEQPPRRVVSINLCTDQLAMLVARPAQLHSVSFLARDAETSMLADQAEAYKTNRGRAEEIFLMKPDLILAGRFTNRATVAMLRRLGFRVEEFAPAASFADIRKNLRRMGMLLGRADEAEALVAALNARLERYARNPAKRPLAAIYFANSYTSGAGTLLNEALELAGLRNLASELGYSGSARLPLEVLVNKAPDVVLGGPPEDRAARHADDNLVHPALRAIAGGRPPVRLADKYWICGTPFTAEAVRVLSDAAADAVR